MRRKICPITCMCLCHSTGGGITAEHGDHPRCPTKDGLPLLRMQWAPVPSTR